MEGTLSAVDGGCIVLPRRMTGVFMFTRIGICASLLLFANVSLAHANFLTNGGLEKDSTPLDQWGMVTCTPSSNSSALPGWTITSGCIDIVPSSYWQVSQGSDSVDLIGTPGLGAIAQSVTTTANTAYTLTFDFAANPQAGALGEAGTTKQLLVEALAADGTTVVASQTYQLTVGTRTISNMQYTANSFDFTTPNSINGNQTTIRLSALTPLNLPSGATSSNVRTGPVVDNLNLILSGGSNPSPEPASLGVLTLGATALLLRRHRAR